MPTTHRVFKTMTAETELSKRYNASLIEDKWYRHWLDQNYFHSEPNPDKKPYVIEIGRAHV